MQTMRRWTLSRTARELNFVLAPFLSRQVPSSMKVNAADLLKKALEGSTVTSGYRLILERLKVQLHAYSGRRPGGRCGWRYQREVRDSGTLYWPEFSIPAKKSLTLSASGFFGHLKNQTYHHSIRRLEYTLALLLGLGVRSRSTWHGESLTIFSAMEPKTVGYQPEQP